MPTQALTRSEKLSRALRGNTNSAKHSWRTFLKRRVLVRPEDRVALHMADNLAAAIAADKGGPDEMSAAEVALLQNIVLAHVCANLCAAELGREGAFRTDEDGRRVSSPAVKEIGRFMAEVRQGLVALGLERRAKKAVTLAGYLQAKAEGRDEPIPVEVVTE